MNGNPLSTPPAAEAVAARALVLGALCLRALLEHAGAEQPDAAEAERIRLLQWLNTEDLAEAVTPAETPVFEAPVGELTPDQTLLAAWRIEALAVLLWALGHRETPPPYDEEADPEDVLGALPQVGTPIGPFRVMAGLRPAAGLEVERERARLWHWRAQTHLLMSGDGDSTDEAALAEAVTATAREAEARGDLPGLLEGDFAALGRPYHELPDEEFGTVASIAAVRYGALRWLCGDVRDWDTADET